MNNSSTSSNNNDNNNDNNNFDGLKILSIMILAYITIMSIKLIFI